MASGGPAQDEGYGYPKGGMTTIDRLRADEFARIGSTVLSPMRVGQCSTHLSVERVATCPTHR